MERNPSTVPTANARRPDAIARPITNLRNCQRPRRNRVRIDHSSATKSQHARTDARSSKGESDSAHHGCRRHRGHSRGGDVRRSRRAAVATIRATAKAMHSTTPISARASCNAESRIPEAAPHRSPANAKRAAEGTPQRSARRATLHTPPTTRTRTTPIVIEIATVRRGPCASMAAVAVRAARATPIATKHAETGRIVARTRRSIGPSPRSDDSATECTTRLQSRLPTQPHAARVRL